MSVHNHVNTKSQADTDIIGPNYVYLLFCVQKYISYQSCASIYEIRDYEFIIMDDQHSDRGPYYSQSWVFLFTSKIKYKSLRVYSFENLVVTLDWMFYRGLRYLNSEDGQLPVFIRKVPTRHLVFTADIASHSERVESAI